MRAPLRCVTGAIALLLMLAASTALAQSAPETDSEATPVEPETSADAVAEAPPVDTGIDSTLATIKSLVTLRSDIQRDIRELSEQMEDSQTTVEKDNLLERIRALDADLEATNSTLHEVAAGANLQDLRSDEQTTFNLQEELVSLLAPAIKEVKDMTSHVRQKSDLRDRINYFNDRLPTTERAVSNLEDLLNANDDPELEAALERLLSNWRKQLTFLQTEMQSARLQLEKLEAQEVSLTEASQSYVKSFFQNRGRYLGAALLVVILILIVSRVTRSLMERRLPGYNRPKRPFRLRLLDLAHRVLTGLLLIIGPMVVFYLAEDWLLFSIGILLLIGIALTLRHALPRYMQQIQLFLNVGTVREGERLELDGLPWLVKQINVFTMLENPATGFTRRLKIDDLVDLRSRPVTNNEPLVSLPRRRLGIDAGRRAGQGRWRVSGVGAAGSAGRRFSDLRHAGIHYAAGGESQPQLSSQGGHRHLLRSAG